MANGLRKTPNAVRDLGMVRIVAGCGRSLMAAIPSRCLHPSLSLGKVKIVPLCPRVKATLPATAFFVSCSISSFPTSEYVVGVVFGRQTVNGIIRTSGWVGSQFVEAALFATICVGLCIGWVSRLSHSLSSNCDASADPRPQIAPRS